MATLAPAGMRAAPTAAAGLRARPSTRAAWRGLAMRAGLWLLLLGAFLPLHGCREHPKHFVPPYDTSGLYGPDREADFLFALEAPDILRRIVHPEPDTPRAAAIGELPYYGAFLLLPAWAGALLLLRLGRVGRALGLGLVLVGLAAGEVVLLVSMGRGLRDPHPALLAATGLAVLAWCWFGPARWGRRDPRPMICAQAAGLLGYALHFPVLDAVKWLARYPVDAVATALSRNYLAGFWCTVLGLALVAAAGYLPRRRPGSRGAPRLAEG